MNLMLVYPAGFPDVVDGGHINIIRGAHLYCDTTAESDSAAMDSVAQDENMANGWMKNKKHPVTGKPLRCERLDLPPGSLICCNTRAILSWFCLPFQYAFRSITTELTQPCAAGITQTVRIA